MPVFHNLPEEFDPVRFPNLKKSPPGKQIHVWCSGTKEIYIMEEGGYYDPKVVPLEDKPNQWIKMPTCGVCNQDNTCFMGLFPTEDKK